MNTREFYEVVINANLNDEVTEFATQALEKMDAANAKRREVMAQKNAEKEAERGPIRDAIMACMTAEPKTATTLIAEAEVEIKPQAMPSLLKEFVADGKIIKSKVKVTGKGMQVGYALASAE